MPYLPGAGESMTGPMRKTAEECDPGADPWQDRAVRLARIVTAIDIEQLRGRPETFDVRSLVCDSRLIVSLSPSGELEWKP